MSEKGLSYSLKSRKLTSTRTFVVRLEGCWGELAAKGWTVVYTTHSSELVSFDEDQVITRMVRSNGSVASKSVHTDRINADAKLQAKLDERGAHDFLFGTAAIFCEGKNDSFAIRLGLEKKDIDYTQGRSA